MSNFDLPPTISDEVETGSLDEEILEWCDAKLSQGVEFLKSQIGYDKIDTAIREIFAFEKDTRATYVPATNPLSKTRVNLTAKVGEDLTAMLTDTRCFWKYSVQNKRYEPAVRLANKEAKHWFNRNMIDLCMGDVMRYYTVAGTGVAHLHYSKLMDDMVVEAEDPRNVFPIEPLNNRTFQSCRGAIVRRARTPEWFKAEFGKIVRPESDSALGGVFGWLQRVIDGPGQRGGPLSKRSPADQPIPKTPTVFVNTLYLKDPRTNGKGKIIRMGPWSVDGKPETPWSYEVRPGEPLYPFNRMIVWGSRTIGYDGPGVYWHAMIPLIKVTLNPWPWSWFGKAPLWDCLPLNQSINSNLRVIDDHAAQVAQPGAVGDRNVSNAEMKKFNTRVAGYKIKTNLSSGKGIQIQNPPPLDAVIWEVVKWCQDMMQKLSGTADPSFIANLAQLPSDDTIDAFMKAMTPAVRLRSRILEGSYKELAMQFLYCILEFDTVAKRIAKFGPEALTKEDFDYLTGSMIPDDVPDGDPGDVGSSYKALSADGPRPAHDRAKDLVASMAAEFDPSSLLNTAAAQELMKYFMLAKMGYVSVFTLLEKMGFENYTPVGMEVPADEISRLKLQQQLGIGMVANSQGRKATDQTSPSMGNNASGPIIQTS